MAELGRPIKRIISFINEHRAIAQHFNFLNANSKVRGYVPDTCRLNGFAAKKCPSPSVLVVTALMTVLFGNHCHGAVSPIAFWNVTQIAGRAGFCLCPDEFSYWWQKSDWVSQLENAR